MNLQTITINAAAQRLDKTARTITRWISTELIPVVALKQCTRCLCLATVEALHPRLADVRAVLSYEEAGRRLKLQVRQVRIVRAWVAQRILPKVKGPDGRVGVTPRSSPLQGRA